jgi:hypothetical protein
MTIQVRPLLRRSWKRRRFAGVVCRGFAIDAGGLEVFAKAGGPPFLLAHVDDRAFAVRVGVHGAEQWEQLDLNGEAAHAVVAGVGLLDAPGVSVVRAAHGDDAALDVHVRPGQGSQLAAAQEDVGHECVQAAVREGDLLTPRTRPA